MLSHQIAIAACQRATTVQVVDKQPRTVADGAAIAVNLGALGLPFIADAPDLQAISQERASASAPAKARHAYLESWLAPWRGRN